MRTVVSGLALTIFLATGATAQTPAPDTPFVRVQIDGTLNMREAPSAEAGRATRFSDGTLLRNLGCDSHEDRNWCEVEALDGSIAGWAAAEFLLPYVGADPAALTTPAIAADSVARSATGKVSGNLGMAGISDHLITLNSGDILTVDASTLPDGSRAIVFGPQGEILAEIGAADAPASIEFAESGEALLRLVEMEGRGGVYDIDLRID